MAPIKLAEKGSDPGRFTEDVQPRTPKISPRRLLAAILVSLITFTLLHKPLVHCYHRMSRQLCHHSHLHHNHNLTVEDRARKVLSSTPLVDGHVDFPLLIRMIYGSHVDNDDFKEAFRNGSVPYHLDLKRLRDGLSGGAFWSVYAPCPEDGDDFSDENYVDSVRFTFEQIDLTTRLKALFPDDFAGNINGADALDAFKSGKLISPLGVEGLHQIGNSVANLRLFHDLGVKYATLTHNCHNKFADAALVANPFRKAEPLWGGVSPLGRDLILEMNRIGLIVDLSHVSEDTMVDVLGGSDDWAGSKAPIIFSHSSAWSVCPHPRNVKDYVLELVKATKSVVLVNISGGFISCVDNGNANGVPDFVPQNSTLAQVAKHIVHIGDLIGYDHVGIGTDFDGIEDTPEGLEDVTKYPDLIAELLRLGVSDSDAAKIVGENVIRVWKAVDEVAAKLQADGTPAMEDDIPSGI